MDQSVLSKRKAETTARMKVVKLNPDKAYTTTAAPGGRVKMELRMISPGHMANQLNTETGYETENSNLIRYVKPLSLRGLDDGSRDDRIWCKDANRFLHSADG